MVSNVKVKKMLSKRWIAYLAHIVNILDKTVLVIKDTPVVKEFSDILLDSLLGLPPKQEVEFSIKLALSIVPISKVSYKIALVKLQELKK